MGLPIPSMLLKQLYTRDSLRNTPEGVRFSLKNRLGDATLTGLQVVKFDDREQYKPGWKFNEWELKGVPLRIEIGPRDVAQDQVVFARRDNGEKRPVAVCEVAKEVPAALDAIQKGMFEKALAFRKANTHEVKTYAEFKERLESEGGFFVADWAGTTEDENRVQEETKATIRCIPLEGSEPQGPCFLTGKPANVRCIFAKAY